MTNTNSDPAIVVGKAYDFVSWLLPVVEKFPRTYRFTLGDRLSSHGLDLLLTLVEAAYASRKGKLLAEANTKVNGARYLLRLSKDFGLLKAKSYGFAVEKLDEIGRMVGGWRKVTA
ncbi:MAG: diversity-generating retroelement protein Avd [bacterium]|nr:diversity-generating retroelement protein Avd [bacterium]